MEALKMSSAGSQSLCCLESSLPARKSASSPSSASSCAAHANRLSCGPSGLPGDGLSSSARRSKRFSMSASSSPSTSASSSRSSSSSPRPNVNRVLRLTSPPRSTAAAAPELQSLEGTYLVKDIDTQDLEAETASLVRDCSDLDWKKLVDDLRSEALHGLQSSGLRALSLKALEKLMDSWLHEQMVDGIELPTAGALPTEEAGWSLDSATCELRMEANLQAAQVLAKGVDSTFDWEADVAELHRRILLQGGAAPSAPRPEERLWHAWAHAQGSLVASDKLTEEALASTAVNAQGMMILGNAESLDTKPQAADEAVGSSADSTSSESKEGKSLLSLGAAVATGIAVEGIWLMDALADEGSPDAIEAASRAPSWLIPAVLIFPPLSYFLFNVYRDQVNPYAKVTDWMFGVVALTIVSNLLMMAVWGVRLY